MSKETADQNNRVCGMCTQPQNSAFSCIIINKKKTACTLYIANFYTCLLSLYVFMNRPRFLLHLQPHVLGRDISEAGGQEQHNEDHPTPRRFSLPTASTIRVNNLPLNFARLPKSSVGRRRRYRTGRGNASGSGEFAGGGGGTGARRQETCAPDGICSSALVGREDKKKYWNIDFNKLTVNKNYEHN